MLAGTLDAELHRDDEPAPWMDAPPAADSGAGREAEEKCRAS